MLIPAFIFFRIGLMGSCFLALSAGIFSLRYHLLLLQSLSCSDLNLCSVHSSSASSVSILGIASHSNISFLVSQNAQPSTLLFLMAQRSCYRTFIHKLNSLSKYLMVIRVHCTNTKDMHGNLTYCRSQPMGADMLPLPLWPNRYGGLHNQHHTLLHIYRYPGQFILDIQIQVMQHEILLNQQFSWLKYFYLILWNENKNFEKLFVDRFYSLICTETTKRLCKLLKWKLNLFFCISWSQ